MIIVLTVAFDVSLALLALWSLRLVRRDRLYVGYGVVALAALMALVVAASSSPGRVALSALAAVSPMLSVTAVAGVIVAAQMFIYVLSQLTIVSNRVTRVVQELALEHAELTAGSDRGSSGT
jgi:hypothetical protein